MTVSFSFHPYSAKSCILVEQGQRPFSTSVSLACSLWLPASFLVHPGSPYLPSASLPLLTSQLSPHLSPLCSLHCGLPIVPYFKFPTSPHLPKSQPSSASSSDSSPSPPALQLTPCPYGPCPCPSPWGSLGSPSSDSYNLALGSNLTPVSPPSSLSCRWPAASWVPAGLPWEPLSSLGSCYRSNHRLCSFKKQLTFWTKGQRGC
jgi:hypothetical protein